jgi:hypothetical protein
MRSPASAAHVDRQGRQSDLPSSPIPPLAGHGGGHPPDPAPSPLRPLATQAAGEQTLLGGRHAGASQAVGLVSKPSRVRRGLATRTPTKPCHAIASSCAGQSFALHCAIAPLSLPRPTPACCPIVPLTIVPLILPTTPAARVPDGAPWPAVRLQARHLPHVPHLRRRMGLPGLQPRRLREPQLPSAPEAA